MENKGKITPVNIEFLKPPIIKHRPFINIGPFGNEILERISRFIDAESTIRFYRACGLIHQSRELDLLHMIAITYDLSAMDWFLFTGGDPDPT